MADAAPTSAAARRGQYFRELVRGRTAFWSLFAGVAASVVFGGALHDVRVAAAGPVVTALAIVLIAYQTAARRAEDEFFASLAPTLGLEYTIRSALPPATPLLAAGDRQTCAHTMQGPLFGSLGGPGCMLAHYTYEIRRDVDVHEGQVTHWTPHRFTVCAVDLGGPLDRYRGLFLRRRPSGLKLDHDWLDRAPKPRKIELESERFNDVYDLRAARDQDDLAVRELFAPSFVVWLAEHPLQPGFECKAGTLLVFVPGHESSAGKLTMLHEAAREITRRLARQVDQSAQAATPATAGR
ncbi:MAG TPA: hypothetical protein VF520_12940 [Thermoleophilaceae bacterium]|jgi:hypothetical protein